MNHKVFVYGSLKRGYGNHRLLHGSDYINDGTTADAAFDMISFGAYPAIMKATRSSRFSVMGEVFEVDSQTLDSLDMLESNGQFYEREQRNIVLPSSETVLAWVYVLCDEYSHIPDSAADIRLMENDVLVWKGMRSDKDLAPDADWDDEDDFSYVGDWGNSWSYVSGYTSTELSSGEYNKNNHDNVFQIGPPAPDKDLYEEFMEEAFEFWGVNSTLSYAEFLQSLTEIHRVSVTLGTIQHYVGDAGWYSWVEHGFAAGAGEVYEALKKINTDASKAVGRVFDDVIQAVQNKEQLEDMCTNNEEVETVKSHAKRMFDKMDHDYYQHMEAFIEDLEHWVYENM